MIRSDGLTTDNITQEDIHDPIISNPLENINISDQNPVNSPSISLNNETIGRSYPHIPPIINGNGIVELPIDELLELNQLQIFYVVLLLLDTFSALLQLYIQAVLTSQKVSSMNTANPSITGYNNYDIQDRDFQKGVTSSLKSLSSFCFIYFVLEMAARYYALGIQKSIQSPGYFADSVVLFLKIHLGLLQYGYVNRALNLFSLWRIIHIFSNAIESEREIAKKIQSELLSTEAMVSQLQSELESEKKDKENMQSMFNTYREEVDEFIQSLNDTAIDIHTAVAVSSTDVIAERIPDDDIFNSSHISLETIQAYISEALEKEKKSSPGKLVDKLS